MSESAAFVFIKAGGNLFVDQDFKRNGVMQNLRNSRGSYGLDSAVQKSKQNFGWSNSMVTLVNYPWLQILRRIMMVRIRDGKTGVFF